MASSARGIFIERLKKGGTANFFWPLWFQSSIGIEGAFLLKKYMKNIIETMNIPPKQMVELKEHINWAKDYICTDNGQEEALFWLHKQTETIRPEYAEAIISTVKITYLIQK